MTRKIVFWTAAGPSSGPQPSKLWGRWQRCQPEPPRGCFWTSGSQSCPRRGSGHLHPHEGGQEDEYRISFSIKRWTAFFIRMIIWRNWWRRWWARITRYVKLFVSFVSFVFCQSVELLESLLTSDGLKMLKLGFHSNWQRWHGHAQQVHEQG